MLPAKLKAYLLNLYPELGKFPLFAEIREISHTLAPVYGPRVKKVLRYGLPIATILLVLSLGITLGSWLISLFTPKEVITTPIEFVSPSAVPTYQSQYLPLKRSIEEFSTQLPDPLPPVFDEKISLEPLSEM